MNKLHYWLAVYDAIVVTLLNVCISSGNRKIGRTWNVSLPPVLSCHNCKACIRLCYAIRDLRYLGVIKARARNWSIFQRSRDEFFGQIDSFLNKDKKHKFFRWHVSGEIVDLDHFERMCETAEKHPDWFFWTYTKMHTVVNIYLKQHGGKLPKNFVVMFSQWDDEPIYNPYNMPAEKLNRKKFVCPGNCDYCIENKTGCVAGKDSQCGFH